MSEFEVTRVGSSSESNRRKTTGINRPRKENDKVFFGLDSHEWHLVIYAALGSMICFFLTDWADSHAPEYYQIEYRSDSKLIFPLPAVLNFVFLFLIFRRMKPVKASNTAIAPILATLTISITWPVGYLGFNLTTVHLIIPFFHIMLAAVVGSTSRIYYVSRHYDDQMPLNQAIREYETRIKLFGDFLQAITILLVSGGLLLMLSFTSEFGTVYLIPGTIKYWVVGTAISLIYLVYGAFCVFLITLWTIAGLLNECITGKERVENNKIKAIVKALEKIAKHYEKDEKDE